MPDIPLLEAAAKAYEVIDAGGTVWQKFTCTHCGARQTMDIPNLMYEHGTCEECGKDTCIHKRGCGLVIAMHIPAKYRKVAIRNGNPTRAD